MSPLNTPASRIDRDLRALGWLTLAIALAYANALTGPFQFDDYNVIVNESAVHSASALLAESGLKPTTTLTPESLRLSAWAWPCEP